MNAVSPYSLCNRTSITAAPMTDAGTANKITSIAKFSMCYIITQAGQKDRTQ